MKLAWDPEKERRNLRKHGLSFSLADVILDDPLALTSYDRFENGEHRWHTIGAVAGFDRVLVVIHTDPSPDDDGPVRVIGLRLATAHERRRYEEGDE